MNAKKEILRFKENIKNTKNLISLGEKIMDENFKEETNLMLKNIETTLDAIVSQNSAIQNAIGRLNLFLTQNVEVMKQWEESVGMHLKFVNEIGNQMKEQNKILKSLKE